MYPSAAMTGSVMTSWVMGHVNSESAICGVAATLFTRALLLVASLGGPADPPCMLPG